MTKLVKFRPLCKSNRLKKKNNGIEDILKISQKDKKELNNQLNGIMTQIAELKTIVDVLNNIGVFCMMTITKQDTVKFNILDKYMFNVNKTVFAINKIVDNINDIRSKPNINFEVILNNLISDVFNVLPSIQAFIGDNILECNSFAYDYIEDIKNIDFTITAKEYDTETMKIQAEYIVNYIEKILPNLVEGIIKDRQTTVGIEAQEQIEQ